MSRLYIAQMGANPILSEAELSTKAKIIGVDEREQLALISDLSFDNPRKIPKSELQLFLDRLGGTQRIARVIGEFEDEAIMFRVAKEEIEKEAKDTKILLAITGFGVSRGKVKEVQSDLVKAFGKRIKLVNGDGAKVTSGRLFHDKVLKKGLELMMWRIGKKIILARTEAIQNLRNYTLRDRRKPFRDAEMGMMPPKLAQMMINLCEPKIGEVIFDPFCGSGTILSEAAIMGYRSMGSDISPERVAGAKANNAYLSEKFRYEPKTVETKACAAAEAQYDTAQIVVSEGWLGQNFHKPPTVKDSERALKAVTEVWQEVLKSMKESGVRVICLCLPVHEIGGKRYSISQKIFAFARTNGYNARALFGGQKSYTYAREGAFTMREIVVLKRDIPG